MGIERPAQVGQPYFFLKAPTTTVIGPDADVTLPARPGRKIDWEGELGAVVGRRCRDVPTVNGVVKQDSTTADMIVGIWDLIAARRKRRSQPAQDGGKRCVVGGQPGAVGPAGRPAEQVGGRAAHGGVVPGSEPPAAVAVAGLLTPSFSKIGLTWSCTVHGEMYRRAEIALVARPCATSWVTARSPPPAGRQLAHRPRQPDEPAMTGSR